MQFCLAACTDRGKTRRVNQDGLLLQQALCGRKRYVLAAVCDGMGGLEKGELASSEVLRSLADWFQSRFPEVLMAGFPERELLGDWKNWYIRKMKGFGHMERSRELCWAPR